MKKLNHFTMMMAAALVVAGDLAAQCGSGVTLGTSSNLFTIIRNDNHPVAVDKDLNMIAFIHRNNAGAFGGNSGHLRYDVSVNAGTTWTLDQGTLNPLNTHLARYPNMAIYNPTLNTNPSNAYVAYMAATINSVNSTWNGLVSGVRQVSGGGNTEQYNQPVINPQLIPHSVVKGAPGVYWAIDALFNGSTITGFAVYKGTWSSSSSDIVWAHNYSVTPSFLAGPVQDYNIAFDPTGTYGWFCANMHVNGGPTTSAYYPTLWRTIDGGVTWTGPTTVDLSKFGCFSSFITGSFGASANWEHDLVVDMYGNPHIFTTIMNSSGYALLYNQDHYMFDITLSGGVWAAYPVAATNAAIATIGTSPDIAQMALAPQAARTADGTKVFFTWADNSNYSLGTANTLPNLFTRAFDVQQKKWTATKDVTSCNNGLAGKILFPHLAPEVLEPSTNVYKLAPVYAELSVPNDALQVTNFHFIDNVTYAASEFSISLPTASVSIQQGSSLLLCEGSTLNINVAGGAGQALWNTGATSPTISVSSGTNNMYIVTAQKDCYVGSDTLVVTNLTVNASTQSGPACPGGTVSMAVAGNAATYTWMPGAVSGTYVTLVAGSTPVFTVNAGGDGCVSQHTVGFNLLQPPTISILGNDTACAGTPASYTAVGASTYLWGDGTASDVFTVSPAQFTVFTVTGTAVNTCTNTQNISVTVIPSPTLLPSASHTAVCTGGSVTLVALGASSYSWSTNEITNGIVVNPVTSSTFEVTGTAPNNCSASHIFTVIVHPLPTLSVSSTENILCEGNKATLTAHGAVSYTWTSPASTSSSINVSPASTTAYVLIGKSAEDCVNTFTYSQVVDDCAGISEQNITTFKMFPNPNGGSFTIRSTSAQSVIIYNQLGQEIKRYEASAFKAGELTAELDTPGLYIVTCGGERKFLIISR